MSAIKVEDLTKEIQSSLKDWESSKWEEVERLSAKKANELLKRVKEDAPQETGEYKKSFSIKRDIQNGHFKAIIYNKKYQLTHLLEKGHVNRDGTSRAKAFPHLLKNESDVNEEYYEELKKIYGN